MGDDDKYSSTDINQVYGLQGIKRALGQAFEWLMIKHHKKVLFAIQLLQWSLWVWLCYVLVKATPHAYGGHALLLCMAWINTLIMWDKINDTRKDVQRYQAEISDIRMHTHLQSMYLRSIFTMLANAKPEVLDPAVVKEIREFQMQTFVYYGPEDFQSPKRKSPWKRYPLFYSDRPENQ